MKAHYATIEHLFHRFDPRRRLPNTTREKRHVLACHECNKRKGILDYELIKKNMNNTFDFIPETQTAKTVDWKSYAVHDGVNVNGFFGDFRFLSNFEPAKVYFEGLLYPSSENAYQAAKVKPTDRKDFLLCSSAESKRLWKQPKFTRIYTDVTWNQAKYDIMAGIVFDKFLRNKELREKLIATGTKYLEELNHWGDSYWGVNFWTKQGQNKLGILLMQVRNFWK